MYRYIWSFISIFEKGYWFIKRKYQMDQLLSCGSDVFISRGCTFTPHTISIGDDVYIGQGCRFQSTASTIYIGSHVMFGPNVSIHGGNHRTDLIGRYIKSIKLNEKLPVNDQMVVIESDVWIGANAIILKGVTIGEGSIIGAGSIVIKSVPPYTILVGSKPQKSFKRWSDEEIEKHKFILRQSESKNE